jgi:hypothetical protein
VAFLLTACVTRPAVEPGPCRRVLEVPGLDAELQALREVDRERAERRLPALSGETRAYLVGADAHCAGDRALVGKPLLDPERAAERPSWWARLRERVARAVAFQGATLTRRVGRSGRARVANAIRTYYVRHMARSTTSIRLPEELVGALDRRAAALGVTRSQLIVEAIERTLEGYSAWSPAFLKAIGKPRPELEETADEMMDAIRARRSRSEAPEL